MPVRGLEQTRRNLSKLADRIKGRMSERALTEALIVAEGYAASLTPMDTGNLLQSMYREVKPHGNGYTARIGFTANYAAAVHAMPGTMRGQPRAQNDPSRGDFWDPDAEPEFLTKAIERDGYRDIQATIRKHMQL